MRFVLPFSVYENPLYNNLRRGYLLLIASLINEYLIEDEINKSLGMILAIEESCYHHAVEIAKAEVMSPSFLNPAFETLYRTKIMRITKNLDINSEVGDEHLALGLLGGIIDPRGVSKLDNKDLSPSRNMKLLEEHSSRLNQKISVKTSTLYRCRQCTRKETTVRSAQMRSLDEGETLIISCTWCGYKWFV
jgi:DNA-directed RNA polymerase subunit RPC12/RpoP